jgi:protease-4
MPSPPPDYPARPRPSGLALFFSWLGRLVTGLTTLVNLFFLVVVLTLLVILFVGVSKKSEGLNERFYGGKESAKDKIAIIRVEGVLFEGLTSYAQNQIEEAAKDDRIKAVVLRIASPGGTITASDDLHQRLNNLRIGHNHRHPGKAKPIVVSMGSVAASGGYYIAMIKSDPPTVVFAEQTTITGSIGVYASFPNLEKLAKDNGIKMTVIKAGDLKNSGSMFKDMEPPERQVWQHMVDHAYLRFLDVVAEARTKLNQAKLQEDVDLSETLPIRTGKEKTQRIASQRYRADGAIFTADQARRLQLIDRIGYLDDAVKEAAKLADLGDNYRAITYDRPPTLLGSLIGIQEWKSPLSLDAERVSAATAPRLWYLAPQHELSGMLTALGR